MKVKEWAGWCGKIKGIKRLPREWEMKGNRVRWEGIKEVDIIRK